MDVDALGEGLLQLRDVGDVGEHAQLDLRIVGRDAACARRGDEGGADLAALLGADRDVLQVRLGRGQPARRRRGQRIGGVHAAGLRVDVARQRVRVGRLQLGELAPFEDPARQLVALLGEILEHAGRVDHCAGRGLLAAGQAHLAEQDVAELLRRAEVEALAGESRGSRPRARAAFCANSPDRRDRICRSIDDAAPLHPRQHRRRAAAPASRRRASMRSATRRGFSSSQSRSVTSASSAA